MSNSVAERTERELIDGVYTNAAGSRPYKLYVPPGYVGQSVPLVVMLHGCTQAADDFAVGSHMNRLADAQTFLVVYPQQRGEDNKLTCWNWWKPENQRRGSGEPSLIAGITEEIMARYRVDPRRVYVAGVSAGGALSATMGAVYPDLYAAIGVHSGSTYGGARHIMSAMAAMRFGSPGLPLPAVESDPASGVPARFVPLIVFQGDKDKVLDKANARRLVGQWLTAYRALSGGQPFGVGRIEGQVPGGRKYTRTIYVDTARRPIVELWMVHGAGHAWAGGSPEGSWTDPQGPDASAAMLRFFLAHTRQEPLTLAAATA